MKPIRIGIITPTYFPNMLGGSELSVKLLAENLKKMGYSPLVFAFDGKRNSVEEVNGVKVIRYKILTEHYLPLVLLPYVAIVMKRWENYVDLYHVYNVTPISGAGLYKILGGKKPVVATLNNYFAFCPVSQIFGECWQCSFTNTVRCRLLQEHSVMGKVASTPYSCLFPVMKQLSKRLDCYIALSKFVKRIYVNFGFDSTKISVIPNFADLTIAHPNRGNYTIKKFFTLLYVGRISPGKGVKTLLAAFSQLGSKQKTSQLLIVGHGPELKECQELAVSLKINDKVTFYGHMDNEDLCKVYLMADVMVQPAVWPEPFGRTLLEAMSFDVPLIVSSAGALPEVAEGAGLSFKCGDSSDLKQKIELVINNGTVLAGLKSQCSEVLKKYEAQSILKKITALYHKYVNL